MSDKLEHLSRIGLSIVRFSAKVHTHEARIRCERLLQIPSLNVKYSIRHATQIIY